MTDNDCILSGIVKHSRGNGWVGFKIAFNDVALAQKYKDMFYYIIKNDDIPVEMNLGYYDDKMRYE